MKKNGLSIGIICLSVAMVCTYCSREEDSLVPEGELPMLKKAAVSNYIPGTDIADQLRSDLEDGLSVTLPAGHFYLGETVIIGGYPGGTIKGAGKDLTILETAEDYIVSENPFLPPGLKTSGIIELHDTEGDVTIKAMSIVVRGEHPAEPHISPFDGYSTNIDNVIAVLGADVSLECKDLRITGEYVGDVEGASGGLGGYNITNPIIGSGWGTGGLFNHLSVKDCEIDGCGGCALGAWSNRTLEFKDNKITNAGMGIWLLDVTVFFTMKDCHFEKITQLVLLQAIGEDCVGCFKDNTLDGQPLPDYCK